MSTVHEIPASVHLVPLDLVDDHDFDEPATSPEDAAWLRANTGGSDLDGPREPHVSFPDWIRIQASLQRLHDSDAGDWLASKIEELAARAAFLGATTPADFEDRLDALEHEEVCRG
jgi:hypothetical protein